MKKILSVFTLIVFLSTNAQIKILFDATKAEMAGNADWVIDADSKSNSILLAEENLIHKEFLLQHKSELPLLLRNLLDGGISAWAIDLVKQGYYVETLLMNR
jgi:hypothetical protein